MKRFIPIPGDLIIVDFSEWYALKDGERLRVCENCQWIDVGEELYVAPRNQVTTFWGPDYGQPDGTSSMEMSTSGGPFKTIRIKDLERLELIGSETDTFWCWIDRPRAAGGMEDGSPRGGCSLAASRSTRLSLSRIKVVRLPNASRSNE